jgi:hypothetical protein
MCTSTLSGEVVIFVSLDFIISADSVIENMSLTGLWHMSGCCLSADLTFVEGKIPFKMGRIATFETLVLSMRVVLTIGG